MTFIFSMDQMRYIAEGLEYPFVSILEETIKVNIEQLLNEQPGWVPETQVPDLYMVLLFENYHLY